MSAEALRTITARDDGMLLGSNFSIRFTYAGYSRTVYMIAPVTVPTAHQGKGIGRPLIAHGLDALRYERRYRRDLRRSGLLWPQGDQARLGGRLFPCGSVRCVAAFDDWRSGRSMIRNYSAFLPGGALQQREPTALESLG